MCHKHLSAVTIDTIITVIVAIVINITQKVTTSKLTVIDLSHNRLGSEAVIILARQLPLTGIIYMMTMAAVMIISSIRQ